MVLTIHSKVSGRSLIPHAALRLRQNALKSHLKEFQLSIRHQHFAMFIVGITFFLALFTGCHTTRVSIQVKVPSEIDVDKYNQLAILPFVDRAHPGKKNDTSNLGIELASVFRRSLNRPHKFEILDTRNTDILLAGEQMDLETLKDTEKLAFLGSELAVDAFITGTYRFSSVSEPRRMYYDRYSASLQRYVTDSVIYYQKSYKLSVEVLVIDADTGDIVWRHPYQSKAWEAHSIASFLISEAVQSNSVFGNLAAQVAASFTRHVAPHYETSQRILVRG